MAGNLFIFNFDKTNMVKLLQHIIQKKNYQYLLLKIGAFMILAFVFDLLIGNLLKHFYFKQTSGWEYRTKYSIEDTKADILIFGASRAQQQYNPIYFEERLNQSCYNVGRDGEPIFYHYGVLKAVLKRYTPKMIILDIENGVFRERRDSYDRIAVLLPFYKNHPEMHSIIELRGPFEKYKLCSQIYPYNSLLFKIATGNSEMNKKRNKDINGYVPLSRSMNKPINTVDFSKKYGMDTAKINIYRSFIKDCKDANIELYIVCSPYFFNAVGHDSSMSIAKEIANDNNIDFIDFSKEKEFLNNSRLFDDTVHINIAGSKIFSNKLVDSIILKQKLLYR